MPAPKLSEEQLARVKFPTLLRARGGTQDSSSCAPKTQPKKLQHDPSCGRLWSIEMDPEVLALAEANREEVAATIVPESQREFLRLHSGLRRFYQDWVLPDLARRVGEKTFTKATLAKDNQALTRWELYTRPEHWSPERDWPGWPLQYITPRVLETFLVRLFASVPAGTARSTWSHLRQILNQAVKVRLIDAAPKPAHIPDGDDGPVQIYQESDLRGNQLQAAYHALRHEVDLQVAFVLAVNAGPRAGDLFLLRWIDFNLSAANPWFTFVAQKTNKRQTIPLAPLTVKHLLRLTSRERDEFLFPRRSSPLSTDPEKSKPARARRSLMAERFLAAGLEAFDRPMQAARATCNTRMENHRTGSGQFLLGHALTLNSRHYYEPSDMVFDAVQSVAQPECFSDF